MNRDDDQQEQDESSSSHLLLAVEDLLKHSDRNRRFKQKLSYQSKSVDNLLIYQKGKQENPEQVSNTAKTEFDLSGIEYDNKNDNEQQIQRSQSAPISITKVNDKELVAFIQSEQQQTTGNNFIYNIDLSHSSDSSRIEYSFNNDDDDDDDDDDIDDVYLSNEIKYEPSATSFIHSSLISNCLTITEENEEELEQLKYEDNETLEENSLSNISNDNQIELNNMNNNLLYLTKDNTERLSTIYESPSPVPELEENNDEFNEKLIVYDIAKIENSENTPVPVCTLTMDRNNFNSCYKDASFEKCPHLNDNLSVSRLCGTTTTINAKPYQPPLTIPNNEKYSSSPMINVDIDLSSNNSKQPTASRSSPTLSPKSKTDKKLSSQHIQKMKLIQSSLSSLSDFISNNHVTNQENVHHSLIDCQLSEAKSENNNIDQKCSSNNAIFTTEPILSNYSTNRMSSQTNKIRRINDNDHSIKSTNTEKMLFDSSSSNELISLSNDKILSQSDYLLENDDINSQKRKASSLKSIHRISPEAKSNILYPIDFENSLHSKLSHQNQTLNSYKFTKSDSGIVHDLRTASKSSIEDIDISCTNNIPYQLNQHEINYHKVLTDLTMIKKRMIDIDNQLNQAATELELEQTLIDSQHELIFKKILEESQCDQIKIRQLYRNLQLLVERIMTEKIEIKNEIDYTQQTLKQLEQGLHKLEEQYRSSDEKVLKNKEIISVTRQKYEDLEFELMELETRCESELEQAEEHFEKEKQHVTKRAQIRQNTLRELDQQQYMILQKAIQEKEKLEREKNRLKSNFKQKSAEATQLEKKLYTNDVLSKQTIYHSTPTNLFHSDGILLPKIRKQDQQQARLSEIKDLMAKIKFEKLTILEEQLRQRYNDNIKLEQKLVDEIQNDDYEVKLREKMRAQERPLTRYLPVRSANFDLRAHIEGAGHLISLAHVSLTSTTCRGYLNKMGGTKFKTWNRRWFVFDRKSRSLTYYQDKNENKLRGCIYFQTILEVYVDHLQSMSLRCPEPREATFIVKTLERTYHLVAPTIEAMRIWVDVIITGAEGNTFAGVLC